MAASDTPHQGFWRCEWDKAQKPIVLLLTEWSHGSRSGLSLDLIWLSEDDLGRPDLESVNELRTMLDSEALARLAQEGKLTKLTDV